MPLASTEDYLALENSRGWNPNNAARGLSGYGAAIPETGWWDNLMSAQMPSWQATPVRQLDALMTPFIEPLASIPELGRRAGRSMFEIIQDREAIGDTSVNIGTKGLTEPLALAAEQMMQTGPGEYRDTMPLLRDVGMGVDAWRWGRDQAKEAGYGKEYGLSTLGAGAAASVVSLAAFLSRGKANAPIRRAMRESMPTPQHSGGDMRSIGNQGGSIGSDKAANIAALRAEANTQRFGEPDVSYRGQHQPTDMGGKNTLDDLADIYPDDIYNPSVAGRYYGHNDPAMDNESARIIAGMRGNPDGELNIYRAVPRGVEDINPGDWVTLNRDYADLHGSSWVDDGGYDILERKVKAMELTTQGDSIHEWGWYPK